MLRTLKTRSSLKKEMLNPLKKKHLNKKIKKKMNLILYSMLQKEQKVKVLKAKVLKETRTKKMELFSMLQKEQKVKKPQD